jgi:hypothetical protein
MEDVARNTLLRAWRVKEKLINAAYTDMKGRLEMQ